MMPYRQFILGFAICVSLGCAPASAQQPFYAGKRLTLLNNFASGGPNDVELRLVAKHLAKHIDGHPHIIVQNKEGAGGLVGTTYLGEVAPRDGSIAGYFTGAAWKYIVEPDKHRVDFRTYEFVAYQGGNAVYYVRKDTAPGIRQAADILRTRGMVAGGLAPESTKDFLTRLTLDMLGISYRYVTGYRGGANARLAVQRGEVQFYSETTPGFLSITLPGMVKEGAVLPTFYDPPFDGERFHPLPEIDVLSIQSFPEFYRMTKGGTPSGSLWDLYRTNLAVDGAMLRMIAFPPSVPQAAVDALRSAFARLNDDATFAAEAKKVMHFAPRYETGPDINNRVRKALTVSPETRAHAVTYMKAGGK